jgi:hypothetical protein
VADQWFYARDSEQHGPIATADLRQMIRSGQVRPDDLVWSDGMENWQPAADVAELSADAAPAVIAPAPVAPTAPSADPLVQIGRNQFARIPAHSSPPQAAPGVLAYAAPPMGGITLTPVGLEMLRQTRPWVRLIAILIYVSVGLYVAGAVAMLLAAVGGGSGEAAGIALAYVLAAGLYLPPAMFLGRYASSIGSLMGSHRPDDLTAALTAQKSFWKFCGIVAVVGLVFMALFLVFLVVALAIGLSGL